jgi:beta-lactamase class A
VADSASPCEVACVQREGRSRPRGRIRHRVARRSVLLATLTVAGSVFPGPHTADVAVRATAAHPGASMRAVSAPAATCRPPKGVLGLKVRSYLSGRKSVVAAAVYDAVNGKTYQLAPKLQFDSGSIVKVQIMGAVFRRAMQAHRPLTATERRLMTKMIEVSDNDAATSLWNEVGGTVGVGAFDKLIPMPGTMPNRFHWGDTLTTAPDNVALIRHYAYPNKVLAPKRRAFGMYLMEHVVPSQRWGVSAGVAPGSTVALKNGWLPIATANWVINSIGYVQGHGREYAIAVLSNHNPSMPYGVYTVSHVSRLVWRALAC